MLQKKEKITEKNKFFMIPDDTLEACRTYFILILTLPAFRQAV